MDSHKAPSPLSISQQELHNWLPESDQELNTLFGWARVCVPHTLAAMDELALGKNGDRLKGLVTFLKKNGVFDEADDDTTYFQKNHGWLLTPLADLIRSRGSLVVVQNLSYGPETEIEPAEAAGRIRTPEEKEVLKSRMNYGGADKSKWLGSLDQTVTAGGYTMPILKIPRMDGQGESGHSVLVVSHNDGLVEYFDCDQNALLRYQKSNVPIPGITKVEGHEHLFYRQPEAEFAERMTGEVMHVFYKKV